jgi:hypothetical protein
MEGVHTKALGPSASFQKRRSATAGALLLLLREPSLVHTPTALLDLRVDPVQINALDACKCDERATARDMCHQFQPFCRSCHRCYILHSLLMQYNHFFHP